ncbi:MAG: Rrf2 family transcriptional regulator [Phycisphaerae bacterium]|nr:Rrf2 family transcriptional regulator [Phycisphaerae bacterium]
MDILRRNTDYALRLAVNLAGRYGDGSVSTRALSDEEDVSYQLACKLMQRLHKEGLVESDMGPKGGFRLARPPQEVPILAIIEAIQGPLRLNRCLLGDGACQRQDGCPIRARIGRLQEQMDQYLGAVTLGELAQSRRPAQKSTRRRRRK